MIYREVTQKLSLWLFPRQLKHNYILIADERRWTRQCVGEAALKEGNPPQATAERVPRLEATAAQTIIRVHLRLSAVQNPKPRPFVDLAYGYLPLVLGGNLAHYLHLGLGEGGRILPVAFATFGLQGEQLPILVAHPAVIDFLQPGIARYLCNIRQMSKRIGQKLSEEMALLISSLPLPVLEDLSEALLDFTTLADLQAWLEDVN